MVRIGVFIISFLILLYSLGRVIFNKERVLKNGTAYKMRIRPIDPGDPFRGKYITLNFEANKFPVKPGQHFYAGQTIFVHLMNNQDGYAVVEEVSSTKPSVKNFVEAKVPFYFEDNTAVSIDYPFTKFYMEETMAPDAERLMSMRSDTIRNAYAKVYLRNGEAVIENVYIGNKTLAAYILENRK